MKNNNRREFIRKSFIGISGAALVPGVISGPVTTSVPITSIPELPVRILGKTGIRTPLISMGTAGAYDPGFVRAAYESGIKLFFSATYYGEGNNEKMVGEGLKGLARDSFVIGTAVPSDGMDNRTGKFTVPFNANTYIKKADESLKRFGLNYVDIFLFPYAARKETVTNEEVLKAMEQLKKQGKTRFVGIASHSDMEEALKAASDSGVYDTAMISYNYKIVNKDSLNEAVMYAKKTGMGVIAMKTTAGASRNKTGTAFNSDAALKWVLQNENLATIVSGMTSLEQMQKNLAILKNLRISDQEMKDLELASIDGESSLYCQQCKKCIPQCPHNLDIPTIMRSYMYAYGYKNTTHAWYTLTDAKLPEKPCENCGICKVKCPAKFNIKNRIADIARLFNVPRDFLVA